MIKRMDAIEQYMLYDAKKIFYLYLQNDIYA